MDTATFYATASALSFTLLGFWWVVVEFKHEEMTADPARRRLSFVVSLHFILPGLMSLAALLTGELPLVWRITFGTAGVVGMVASVMGARGAGTSTGSTSSIGRWMWLGLPLYAVITMVALRPDLVRSRLALEPLQIEGSIMTLLVLLGISFAWVLFTEPVAHDQVEG
jgi:hypothetical protein